MRSHTEIIIAFLIALATASCQPAPPVPPEVDGGRLVLDLIAEFPVASHNRESAVIDLGTPAARRHLVSGWGADEQDGDATYTWGLGEAATVSFFAVAPTDVTLDLHCKPLVFEGMPDQVVSIVVNDQPLADIPLGRKLKHHEIEIPSAVITPGQNQLQLRFAASHRPRDVIAGTEDARQLAVRCNRFELNGLGAGEPPDLSSSATDSSVDPAREDRIELPVGTAVTYYFDQPTSSELVIPALDTWGPRAEDVRLLVRSRSAEASEETTYVIDHGHAEGLSPRQEADGMLRIPLATEGSAVDRLEIAAVSDRRRHRGLLQRLGWARKTSGLSLALPSVRDPAGPLAPRPETHPGVTPPAQPNVIIYLIDTLRADHLGAYGYSRPTSPNIDRFAADGILFENAQAQSSWTRPSVVSLFTGLRPRAHGVNQRQAALPDTFDTLAELLARQGYATAAFVTNGNAGPDFGLDQGFELFRYLRESGTSAERHQLSDSLNQYLFQWLERRDHGERPFFLFAHATDPHAPYTPREPFRSRFAAGVDPEIGLLANVQAIVSGRRETTAATRQDLIDLYDAEIAFNDHHFGQLIARLKERQLYRESLIILLSDHGEEFLDHGWWEHGVTLYGEQLDVPMILKLPANRQAGTRVKATASQMDVLPTILDLLGVVPPATITGGSLLNAAGAPSPPSFAYLGLQNRRVRSITRNGWKLILDDSRYPRGEPRQLYRIETDPEETDELATRHPYERELLAQLMRRWELDLARGAAAAGEQAEIPAELRNQLEALGYL